MVVRLFMWYSPIFGQFFFFLYPITTMFLNIFWLVTSICVHIKWGCLPNPKCAVQSSCCCLTFCYTCMETWQLPLHLCSNPTNKEQQCMSDVPDITSLWHPTNRHNATMVGKQKYFPSNLAAIQISWKLNDIKIIPTKKTVELHNIESVYGMGRVRTP